MLASAEQYEAILEGAATGGYALPAINVTSSRTLNAALRGFSDARSDGILQVTVGGARYLSGPADDGFARARALAALALLAASSERGVVGGEEDGIGGGDARSERLYTTPEAPLHVAEALRTGDRGRYLLAATFGNVHGHYAPGRVRLRPQILADGQAALERRSNSV